MLLKNLMEDKQLNFDQPLLSVRRQIPTLTTQKHENRRIDSYSYQVRPQIPTYRSELKSGPIRDPGAVPFLWEHSPGQPKEETKAESRNFQRPPVAPTLPPGRAKHQDPCENKKQEGVVSSESRTSPSRDENVRKIERSKDNAKEEEDEGSDSGDSDEAYVDARSTLSRTDYSFLNCSMSGLSGVEHSDVKPSRSFLKDPEAREFMMDRFLPAAKAMASETPHAPKKQPVQLQPKQAKKRDNQCTKPSLRYGPSFAKKYSYNEMEEEEEEDSDDEYNQQAHLPSVCGLLPRFCLKSNLSLLSPVPGMSVRTRVPTSPASKVRPRSSSSGSYSEIESESRSDRAEIRSIDKIEAAELHEDKAKSRSDSGQLEIHDQNEVLPCKGLKTFQEFLDDRGSPDQSNAEDPVLEKTLHVDTVHKVNSPKSMPFSPNTQESVTASKLLEEDAVKSSKTEQMQAIDLPPPHKDLKKLHTVEGDAHLLPNAQKVGRCDVSPLVWEMPRGFEENQDFKASLEKLENSQQNHSELPPPPPLPKSPSDSWLGRTLPSMNTKHSNLRPFLGAATTFEGNYLKAPKSDMKWETIVKTTKVQRRHLHYSEESLTTIPEA